MPTGDKRANIYLKRNMSQEAWEDHFYFFLDDKINDTTRATFLQRGILSDQEILLTSSANDTVTFDISSAARGVDEDGHIMDLSNVPSSWITSYPFANANGVAYYFGFRYQSIPDDIERNPRSSEPEYPWYEDAIGEQGAPDSVTDNTTYIRLVIDGILENGVDHSSRPVMVWLNNPVSPVAATAYYTGTVGNAAGVNYVDIPYSASAGPLGQTAPAFPISTTAADYSVWVKGMSWFKNTDLRTDSNYVFVGIVTGNGPGATPVAFNITDQRPVFLISLDRAYRANSASVPAPGRTIFADSYAVKIQQSASANRGEDESNTAFLIDKLGDSVNGSYGIFWYGASVGDDDESPWAAYRVAKTEVAASPQDPEIGNLTVATPTVTFTRVGLNMLTSGFTAFFVGGDRSALAYINGTTGGVRDGLYWVDKSSVAATTFDVINLDGSAVSWAAGETGVTIRILYPVSVARSYPPQSIPAWRDRWSFEHSFPSAYSGVDYRRYLFSPYRDQLVDTRYSVWDENDNDNPWLEIRPGRIVSRGGGPFFDGPLNYKYMEGYLSGWANYIVDKRLSPLYASRFDSDLTGSADEGYDEWGYDYRGTDFGKSATTDQPPYQLAATFRIPYWQYNGGADDVLIEENDTVVTAVDSIRFDRVGFTNVNMPIDSSFTDGMILAEIQFDSDLDQDGVYACVDKSGTDTIQFVHLDGTTPAFSLTDIATVRFWGGVFVGPRHGPGDDSFLMDMVPPTPECGGLRYAHATDNAIGSTDEIKALYCVNNGSAMFGVADGGITFARSLSTRGLGPAQHGLTQWNEVSTALVTADVSNITSMNAHKDNYVIQLSGTTDKWSFVNPPGGSTSNLDHNLNIFAGISNLETTGGDNQPVFFVDSVNSSIKGVSPAAGTIGAYFIPILAPNTWTIDSVTMAATPTTGDGTANSMGIAVYSRPSNGGALVNLYSGGQVYFNGGNGVSQQKTITLDQNNTIDNGANQYWVYIKGSTPGGSPVADQLRAGKFKISISQPFGNSLVFGY
jgi:hypothetical protein